MKLKNSVFLTDLFLKIVGYVPPYVLHNVGKALALKISFWHLNIDQIEGAYVEFGVASGNSMRSAEIAEKRSQLQSLGINRIKRTLYGFDTFSSFSSQEPNDSHTVWRGKNFSFELKSVKKRFRRELGRVNLFKLDLSKVFADKQDLDYYIKDEFIAIALMDMDLGDPTYQALEWIFPKLNDGSIILFDEFFAFAGDPSKGEHNAWVTFLKEHPQIQYREFFKYGDGGVAFQINFSSKGGNEKVF